MSDFTVLALFLLALLFFSWASTTSSTCPGARLLFNVSERGAGCVDVIVGDVSTPSPVSKSIEAVHLELATPSIFISTPKCKSP